MQPPVAAERGRHTECACYCGRRSGYILVFFAMILFGIMALAALVIDIGFARLTQRQMQTAVDAAALEGLRWRDVQTWEEVPQDWSTDPTFRTLFPGDEDFMGPIIMSGHKELIRRWAASRTVAMVFDDELNSGIGDNGAFYDDDNPAPNAGQQFNVAGQFGAGPVLRFTDGAGSDPDLAASEFINDSTNPNPNPKIGSYPATPVYKPDLQLNIDDNVANKHGDLVAGTFDYYVPNPDFNPLEGDPNPAINEYSNPTAGEYYARRNFVPSAPATSNAFLVRMRRSNNFDGFDVIADESSSGPPVPYLFGRGSLLAVRDPEMVSEYLPRRHGMTVRATAIADARPALSIGFPNNALRLPGLITNLTSEAFSLSVSVSGWESLTGPLVLNRAEITRLGIPVGRFFPLTADVTEMPVMIGRQVPATTSSSPPVDTYTGYVPIFDDVDSVNRIVAFGIATAQVTSATQVTVTREVQQIAPENASGVLCYPRPPGMSVDEWRSVLDSIFPVDESIGDVLLAPVSAR